jgi:hypothetical protein
VSSSFGFLRLSKTITGNPSSRLQLEGGQKMSAVHERKDIKPERGEHEYGDVKYADETNKKYPIDTEKHIRAAHSYINHPDNAAKYSAEDVKTIKKRINDAAKEKGIEISTE